MWNVKSRGVVEYHTRNMGDTTISNKYTVYRWGDIFQHQQQQQQQQHRNNVRFLSMLDYHVECFHISLDLQNIFPDCVGIFRRVWVQD